MAEDYRPKLIPSNIFNLSVKLKVDTVELQRLLNFYKLNPPTEGIVIPLSELKFKFSLWLYNRGNSQANLTANLVSDSVYYGRILETTLEKPFNAKFTKLNVDTGFVAIDKDDSLRINIEYVVQNIFRNEIIIHLYFLYENEQKYLYSSYCWIRFSLNATRLTITDSSKIIGIHNELQLNQQDLKYLGITNYPSVIAPQDTGRIQNFIRSIFREMNLNKIGN